MRRILKNWNFKKHLALITTFYTVLFAAANAIMLMTNCKKSEKEVETGAKWMKYISPEEQKKAVAASYVMEPSKATKLVNGIIGACFLVDMAAYPVIKKLSKRI